MGEMVTRARFVIFSTVVALTFSAFHIGIGVASAGEGGPVKYGLYFGDLHTHTSYSDGWTGTPWDAYATAKACGADYMATTDHDTYGQFFVSPEEWADTLAAAAFYTSSKFVAMPGYQFRMAAIGEINLYNTRDFPSVPSDPDPREVPGLMGSPDDVLPVFYDWLAQQPGAVGQWTNPELYGHNFRDFAFWSEDRDRGMGSIEVWNWKYLEDSYIRALDGGWHVMPAAVSDTHNPDWICGSEVRTVLMASRLTSQDLYAALSASRGYGTLDKNLHITYSLNGAIMGSTLTTTGSRYSASIHIEDPDRTARDEITLVEIVSDGGSVVAKVSVRGTLVDLAVPLTSETARYFYVRVSTASVDVDSVGTSIQPGEPGVTAWTAPVWTGR